jgi:hypothetical protein
MFARRGEGAEARKNAFDSFDVQCSMMFKFFSPTSDHRFVCRLEQIKLMIIGIQMTKTCVATLFRLIRWRSYRENEKAWDYFSFHFHQNFFVSKFRKILILFFVHFISFFVFFPPSSFYLY